MDGELVLIFIIGFLTGNIAGLLGIGGGVLIIPAILYIPPLFHFPSVEIKAATGIAAIQAVASSLSASWVHYRKGNLIPGLMLVLGGSAMIGGYFGGLTTDWYPERLLQLLLLLAIVAVLIIYIRTPAHRTNEETLSLSLKDLLHLPALWPCSLLAVAVGYFAGILGIGGSIFLIPIMAAFLHIPTRNTIGTGAGTVLLIAAAASLGKWQTGLIPWHEALAITLGAFLGGIIGARLTNRIPSPVLKKIFTALMMVTLVRVLWGFLTE